MSIVVKTWQPNPECEQCAQAERNNREAAVSGKSIYAGAMKKVRALHIALEHCTHSANMKQGVIDHLREELAQERGR